MPYNEKILNIKVIVFISRFNLFFIRPVQKKKEKKKKKKIGSVTFDKLYELCQAKTNLWKTNLRDAHRQKSQD